MTTIHESFIKAARSVPAGTDLYGGHCLDFAAGAASSLRLNGYDAWVTSIERDDLDHYSLEEIEDLDPGSIERILSHAVVSVMENGREYLYDGDGIDADERWDAQFNEIREANGEPEVDFKYEDHKEAPIEVREKLNKQFNMNGYSTEVFMSAFNSMQELLKEPHTAPKSLFPTPSPRGLSPGSPLSSSPSP